MDSLCLSDLVSGLPCRGLGDGPASILPNICSVCKAVVGFIEGGRTNVLAFFV
jgi:hypothetical protein